MTRESFNQLFNEYRQQVVEASTAAVQANSPNKNPDWLTVLQRHVQEWKQHYGSESQAIQAIKTRHMYSQFVNSDKSIGVEQEISEVTKLFQLKRETIWIRQQHELSKLGISMG
ncbi:hypothetical protein [Spirosoma fluviale]|uniref:Uncharacterized protein n=1 Tax=Spirosoma fluviale TaxID=1597977 RepID=A0A286G446_9BACT|nr:hypothetical protein [Spirosoma fluviale]SOD89919.1 hypothetical protein SAMN06269250_3235 [Spirosoma fluviale]